MQSCGSSVLSDCVLVDFLRYETTAITAFVGVDVIDQPGAFLENKSTGWAFDLLHFGVVLSVSAYACGKVESRS